MQSSESDHNVALPSTSISRRQRAKLIALQLPDADQAVLVETLSDFKSRAFEISHPASPQSSSAAYKNPEIVSAISLNDATTATVRILQRKMTSSSFQRLHDYVQAQKKYMKQIPYPEMKQK